MDAAEILARTNIESILIRGLISPPTIEHMEKVLDELRAKRIKEVEDELKTLKKEDDNGDQV